MNIIGLFGAKSRSDRVSARSERSSRCSATTFSEILDLADKVLDDFCDESGEEDDEEEDDEEEDDDF